MSYEVNKQFDCSVCISQYIALIAAWLSSAGWRWKMFSSYRCKEELNSFIAWGIKVLLSLSAKQGGESSLPMNVFPFLAMVPRGAWWLLQSRLLGLLFSVFPLPLEHLKCIWSETCCVELTGLKKIWLFWRSYFFFSFPTISLFCYFVCKSESYNKWCLIYFFKPTFICRKQIYIYFMSCLCIFTFTYLPYAACYYIVRDKPTL